LPLGQPHRIERTAPRRVLPARRADVEHASTLRGHGAARHANGPQWTNYRGRAQWLRVRVAVDASCPDALGSWPRVAGTSSPGSPHDQR
jgi:hypothetical protein